MLIRSISAIGAVFLLVLVMLAGKVAFSFAVFVLSIAAIYEFFNCISAEGAKPLKAFGYAWCISIPLFTLQGSFGYTIRLGWLFLAMFLSIAVLFAWFVFRFEKTSSSDISSTLFGTIYIVSSFLCLVLLRVINNGEVLVWVAFIGAWATDTFAYLTGITLGKRKILPEVSPKKSLEGTIGGIVGCTVFMTIFGVIIGKQVAIELVHFVVLGLLCGVFSQLGDWAMSAFKRKAGIKDFGKFLPGHGGVLDRFDSILFIAPLIIGYLSLVIWGK